MYRLFRYFAKMLMLFGVIAAILQIANYPVDNQTWLKVLWLTIVIDGYIYMSIKSVLLEYYETQMKKDKIIND